jgi:hypothetical protein
MSDIRTRLADALREHASEHYCSIPPSADGANHVADVLLSLPGIAIVDVSDADSAVDAILRASRAYQAANTADHPPVE